MVTPVKRHIPHLAFEALGRICFLSVTSPFTESLYVVVQIRLKYFVHFSITWLPASIVPTFGSLSRLKYCSSSVIASSSMSRFPCCRLLSVACLADPPVYETNNGVIMVFTSEGFCTIDKEERFKCPIHAGARWNSVFNRKPRPFLNGSVDLSKLTQLKPQCDLRNAHVLFRTALHWRQALRHNLTPSSTGHSVVIIFKTIQSDYTYPAWPPGVYLCTSDGSVVGCKLVGDDQQENEINFIMPVFSSSEYYHAVCTVELSQYDTNFAKLENFVDDELYFMLLEHKIPIHETLAQGRRKRRSPKHELASSDLKAKINNYGVYLYLYVDKQTLQIPDKYSQLIVWPVDNRAFEKCLFNYIFNDECPCDQNVLREMATLDPCISLTLKPEHIFD
ncbi:hypothetical protein [Ranid herpesvirus 3]|uniref:Uncharacterized protein n=1 Tax=Ranid herpesvirus 3 TaxID=1987509 RepID=A0A1X9T5I7_9VIRU|nr:hypothetical protein [Ranid herpesvirus 3]ARR28966.1 hypothetical protein [Ranid herpesvirus 3]